MAALGAVIASMLIGALVFYAVADTEAPPAFRTRVVRIVQAGDAYTAQVDVANVGGAAASGVEVGARLEVPRRPAETARAHLEHLPAGATGRVGLVFSRDPGGGRLLVSVDGYRRP